MSSQMSSHEFDLKIFKLLSNDDKNTVFSPFSLTTCLSMLLMGIRSNSSQQLSKALFGEVIEEIDLKSFGERLKTSIEKSLNEETKAILWSNLMYSDTQFPVLSEFNQLIQKYFSANIKTLDFIKDKMSSIYAINSDIKSATNGKIPQLLEDLDDNTFMVLANALYFKGVWDIPFDPRNTITDKFLTKGGEVDVEMMSDSRRIPYTYNEHLKVRAVQLSYGNTKAVMIVLLPDTDSSLKQLKDSLSIETINDLLQNSFSVKVDLFLPKFKIESTFDLIPSLKDNGIKDIFDYKRADFSGITSQKGLFVSMVLQKAVIEVNEEGTEAAAATAVGISFMCIQMNEEFRANRPFLYMLVTKSEDNKIDSILFIGECNNPNLN